MNKRLSGENIKMEEKAPALPVDFTRFDLGFAIAMLVCGSYIGISSTWKA